MTSESKEPPPFRLWAVYDHPKDFPESFVARMWEGGGGWWGATESFVQAPTLTAVREQMMEMGLVCIQRYAEDDPVIVESWI